MWARVPRVIVGRRNIPTQLFWYVLVGGLSLCADLVVFFALLPQGLAPAVVLGFVVGTLVNYVLSQVLAFTGGRFSRPEEIIRLFAVALVGVGLTLGLVLLLTQLGLTPAAAKAVATVIVFGWNYLGRRLFVFAPEMPSSTWRLSNRSLENLDHLVQKDNVDG